MGVRCDVSMAPYRPPWLLVTRTPRYFVLQHLLRYIFLQMKSIEVKFCNQHLSTIYSQLGPPPSPEPPGSHAMSPPPPRNSFPVFSFLPGNYFSS